MSDTRDPIAFELFKNAIFSIADEMALTVFRTTYSGVLKDNMDYSTGFADAEGKLVAQGLTLPGHLGSVPTAMQAIMSHYRDDIAPGDVFAPHHAHVAQQRVQLFAHGADDGKARHGRCDATGPDRATRGAGSCPPCRHRGPAPLHRSG